MKNSFNIGAAIICKNNSKTILKTLNSIENFCSQIVIVDTGSTDETPKICLNFGAEVYFHKWKDDFSPIDPDGTSYVDQHYSKAYLRHLFNAKEMLAAQIGSIHNLAFYLWLVGEARKQILAGTFKEWKEIMVKQLAHRL